MSFVPLASTSVEFRVSHIMAKIVTAIENATLVLIILNHVKDLHF